MNKARLISTVFVLVCLIATVSYLPGAYASSQVSLVPVNPSGSYRWLDVAGQAYGSTYQQTYTYSQATVNVAYDTTGSSLRGTLTATNLKPNFAYQLKLEGTPGTAGNEKIGYTGRWWEEEWSGVAWVNGQNIVDQTYIDNQNELYSDSPPVNLYRFTGYLLFDYFITDNNGDATLQFETGSSYNVLWKTTQRIITLNDGPTKTAIFDPASSKPVYSGSAHTVSIFGEWERLQPGQVNLQPETYNCQIILTEESFHETDALAGSWAGAMTANIVFSITPAFPLPEYPLGALIALSACIATFAVYKVTKKPKTNNYFHSPITQLFFS